MKLVQLTKKVKRPILGEFGKAVKNGVAFNYGISGGPDCDKKCTYHPVSTSRYATAETLRCYAWNTEGAFNRKALKAKQERHQLTDRNKLTELAYKEVERKPVITWFRFSAFGSCPLTPPKLFRKLCKLLKARKIDIHLPLESWAKTRRYRKELGGLNIAVRRSCQSIQSFLTASIRNNPLSVVVGNKCNTRKERIRLASIVASKRAKRTGKKCIVCPAVVVSLLRINAPKAKCGSCTACADIDLDIVYPAHV